MIFLALMVDVEHFSKRNKYSFDSKPTNKTTDLYLLQFNCVYRSTLLVEDI